LATVKEAAPKGEVAGGVEHFSTCSPGTLKRAPRHFASPEAPQVLVRPLEDLPAGEDERGPGHLGDLVRAEHLVRAAEVVAVTHVIESCRDPKDNKFLELALSGSATHLMTGDDDLLSLGSFGNAAILTPAQYLQLFPASPPGS
jgi:hypothetical protein